MTRILDAQLPFKFSTDKRQEWLVSIYFLDRLTYTLRVDDSLRRHIRAAVCIKKLKPWR